LIVRFQVKKKEFFRNFIAIMLFGVVGVFISFAIISTGMPCLLPGEILLSSEIGIELERDDLHLICLVFDCRNLVFILQARASKAAHTRHPWCDLNTYS